MAVMGRCSDFVNMRKKHCSIIVDILYNNKASHPV